MGFLLGGGIIGSVINAAANMGTSYMNNKMAEQREQQAREDNFKYGEMAADAADARQRAQWADMYSIGAQVKQLKENGLSLSAMYGGTGGQGGATAPQGSGAAGVQPNVFGIPPLDVANSVLAMAQAKLAEKQAGKAEAEAQTISGKNARGIAEIQEIYSKAGYNNAAKALAEANTAYQELKTFVDTQKAGSEIQIAARTADKLLHETNKAYEEAQQAGLKTKFDKETYTTRVEQAGEDLALTYAECALKNSQKDYTDAQKTALQKQVLQKWAEIGIKYNEMLISGESQKASQKYMEDRIKAFNKELDIKETEMWLDFGVDCAESVIKLADLITDIVPATAAVKTAKHIFNGKE